MILPVPKIPVSYTHLDVYKRQEREGGGERERLLTTRRPICKCTLTKSDEKSRPSDSCQTLLQIILVQASTRSSDPDTRMNRDIVVYGNES